MATGEIITVPRDLVGLPMPGGAKSIAAKPSTLSKGIGYDRLATRILNNLQCDATKALQQTVEMLDIQQGKHSLSNINNSVHVAAGLDVHTAIDDTGRVNTMTTSSLKVQPTKWIRCVKVDRRVQEKDNNYLYKGLPCLITIDNLNSDVIWSRTGFQDVQYFLCFVAVITGGDIDCMTETCSYLSWLEEWFFFVEMMYGRMAIRWDDHARNYKISKYILQRVFQQKLALLMAIK